MTQNELVERKELLQTASEKLDALLVANAECFPKGFNKTRFLQNCITVMRDTKNIEKCTPISIARCMVKGAFLDLDFFRKECYAIAYFNKDLNKHELNFQTDYKGEIKLCSLYAIRPILNIDAFLVREGDEINLGMKEGKPVCDFTPKPFNDAAIIGAIAFVSYKDGGFAFDAMSKSEIEAVRANYSKVPDGPAWKKSLGEMYKKIVIRRLSKKIAIKFDRAEQDDAYDEGGGVVIDAEVKKPEVVDPFLGDGGQATEKIALTTEDQALFDQLKARYPNDEDWQIKVRIGEIKERGGEK